DTLPHLELLHPLDRDFAEHARAVRRARGRGVERGDDVLSRRVAEDLAFDVHRDLLRGDELHEPERGQRLELAEAEETVLAGIEVDAVERPTRRGEGLPPGLAERLGERDRRRRVDPLDRPAALADLAVADALPADRRRGLDLLARGTARRA